MVPGKFDVAFQNVEEDYGYLKVESKKLYKVIEGVNNNLQKNNFRLKGLKEGVEEGNLKQYLETLLTG